MTQSDSDNLPTMGEQYESELSMSDNETQKAPDAVTTQPHVLRMLVERDELDKKGQALTKFIRENPTFNELPERDKELLKYQAQAMGNYFAVLSERIFRAQNPDQAKEYDAKIVLSKQEAQARADREFGQPHHGHGDGNG